MTWDIAEVRDRLTEVVELALTQGPQTITRRRDAVVLISAARFEELSGQRPGFKGYLAEGESFDGLELTRDPGPGRDVEL